MSKALLSEAYEVAGMEVLAFRSWNGDHEVCALEGVSAGRDWCRYRYICRLSGFPARGGCRPKRSGFGYGLLTQSSSIFWSFLLLLSLCISIFFLCANNKSKILDISFESENFLGFFMFTKLLISKLCK